MVHRFDKSFCVTKIDHSLSYWHFIFPINSCKTITFYNKYAHLNCFPKHIDEAKILHKIGYSEYT